MNPKHQLKYIELFLLFFIHTLASSGESADNRLALCGLNIVSYQCAIRLPNVGSRLYKICSHVIQQLRCIKLA